MKKWQKTGLLIVWCIIIAGCFYFRKELTTEQILNHTPGNLLAAFFMMMGLFAVKSVSVVIYSGLLFAVSGMIFPMKFAIAVNFCGAAIMVTLPWLIGKKGGGTMVSSIMKKYPEDIQAQRHYGIRYAASQNKRREVFVKILFPYLFGEDYIVALEQFDSFIFHCFIILRRSRWRGREEQFYSFRG